MKLRELLQTAYVTKIEVRENGNSTIFDNVWLGNQVKEYLDYEVEQVEPYAVYANGGAYTATLDLKLFARVKKEV